MANQNPNADYKPTRIDHDDDPERCEGLTHQGNQCQYKRVPGRKVCECHGGVTSIKAQERKGLYNFRVSQFKARISDFATNPALKSLREEIGVLRMLLETAVNRCSDEHELLLASSSINQMVLNIERLVASCHKLEINLGQLLDRNKAVQLAEELVTIITSELDDETAIARIASKIGDAMERITLTVAD